MKNYIKLTVVFILTLITSTINAQQITTNPTITPVQAVEDILLGAGIQAFNISYNGSTADANIAQDNVQEFDATGTTFPIETGVLMSSNGDGTPLNDPDIDMLTFDAQDGAIIEFDFIPTGDTLSFNYIFASDEYDGYTCADFTDVFAFFLSGPGINGTFSNNAENIALIPGTTTPVAINTVNSGTASAFQNPNNCEALDPNWQSNSTYFTAGFNTLFSNSDEPMSGVGIDPPFNGSTVVLPATADLVCNDTFHIKLVIANDFDSNFPSGVFLQANSFSSNVVQISSDAGANVNVLDSVLVEGCSEGAITFIRPEGADPNDTIVAPLIFSGSATQGDDFPQLSPGDSVTLLPGEDTITLSIIPTDDGVNEGIEDLTITTFSISVCGDTVFSDVTFYFADEPPTDMSLNDTTLYCDADSAYLYVDVENGFSPFDFSWSTGETTQEIWYSDLEDGENYVVVTSTDDCGFEFSDTALVQVDQTLAIDTMIQNPSECGGATGWVSGQGGGFTGTPDYEWSGPGANSSNSFDANVWEDLSSGWYYFTIEDDVCKVQDSIFVEQDPPPTADFTANPPIGNAPLDVTFTNNSDPADTYDWDFGNGDSISVTNLDDQFSTYGEEGVYTVTLTVTEGSCTDQATEQIIVELVLPLSYDMPNVFTPNNDGSNDEFTLNTVNAVSLDLVILNRWGNVVYESSEDVNASWNGKVQNSGIECNNGTYFYEFTITGEDGEEIQEHGFVQLVRDDQ